MGHISSSSVNRLESVVLGTGELACEITASTCEICSQAKLTKKSFNKDRDRASRPCEILHADLIGPISPPTFVKKNSYILSVTDDYTHYIQTFILKTKTGPETAACVNEALRFLQAQFPGAGQFDRLRCDNGLEFTRSEILKILEKYGIVLEESEAYCHEHNGLAERVNRTIQERA